MKDRGRDKDILNKLREILAEEYKSNSETRTLIFVETRYLAVALSEYLNKSNELKKLAFSRIDSSHHKLSDYLTSTNSSKKTGGMAPADQRIVLSAFDQGRFFLLFVSIYFDSRIHEDFGRYFCGRRGLGYQRVQSYHQV